VEKYSTKILIESLQFIKAQMPKTINNYRTEKSVFIVKIK